MSEKDIVTDILQRAMDVVRAEMGPTGLSRVTCEALIEHIGALERPVRQHWGGGDLYVAKKGQTHTDARIAAVAEIRRTGKVSDATRHGVSRATLYRALSKRV